MDIREIRRWIKKGYLLVFGAIILNLIAGYLNMTTLHQLMLAIVANPKDFFGLIFGLSLLSIAFIFLAYPLILGYLLEYIDRKVRK